MKSGKIVAVVTTGALALATLVFMRDKTDHSLHIEKISINENLSETRPYTPTIDRALAKKSISETRLAEKNAALKSLKSGSHSLELDKPLLSPPPSCVVINFQHKALAGHPDRQHCARHRNFLSMGTPKELIGVNWKSICLKVDGTPTSFERQANGISFGPLAGPDSTVSLRYCRGKITCPNNCALPRDAFMDAIGASLKHEKNVSASLAKWDLADPEDDPDPTAGFEAELGDDVKLTHGLSLFRDWSPISRTPHCGTSVASRL